MSTGSLKAHNIDNVPYNSVITRNQNAVERAVNLAGALYLSSMLIRIGARKLCFLSRSDQCISFWTEGGKLELSCAKKDIQITQISQSKD